MKKLAIVLTICMVCCFASVVPATAFDKWTTEDTVKEGLFLGLLYLDQAQLKYAVTNQCRSYTTSPFVGLQRSDKDKIETFFIASAILHPVIAYVLPQPYRAWWQVSGIVVEAYSVGSNMSAGVGFQF
jgi:hypothetical protein